MSNRRTKLSKLIKALQQGSVSLEVSNLGQGGEYFVLRGADRKLLAMVRCYDLFDHNGNRFDY
jgi:hypothetical protein